MKINRIITIGLFLTIALLGFSTSIYSSEVVILNSPSAGNLKLTKEALTAIHLKITGKIDARDFKTLKTVTINRTRILDLSEAEIVSYSGNAGCYAPKTSDWIVDEKVWYHTYEANTLPIHAFTEVRDNSLSKRHEGSYSLRQLILPSSLKNIEYDALRYNNMLTEIITPENSKFLVSDGHTVYTIDKKKLVAIAPAYTGSLNIPATVEEIDSCAFSGLKLTYVSFNSPNPPQMKGSKLLDAACVVIPNNQYHSEQFNKLDCVNEVEDIVINNIVEDELLVVLGNMGYRREDVREIQISGRLSQNDIKNLISLPNLHKLDLSQVSTTANYITIDKSSLCDIKLPSGKYELSIGSNNYLEGQLIIPEGVHSIDCSNPRFSIVKFPSTLMNFTEDSFYKSIIKEADFSNCSSLIKISGFSLCANLEKLLLPPVLSELEGVSCADLTSIEFPKTLTQLSYCNNWSVDTLRLPTSIKGLHFVGEMPNLKHVDISSCSYLTSVSSCFYDCPKLETIDFSKCPISNFSGFDGKNRLSDYLEDISTKQTRAVITGGTQFPAPKYSGLKSIKFPSSLEELSGFNNCEQLENLLLGHCYRLKQISGFTNCSSLDSVALPSNLSSVCRFNGSHIKHLSIASTNPPKITAYSENCGFTESIVWVPNGYSGIYRMSEGWSQCKEIKDGGYAISFNVEGPVCLLNGAGLYHAGETAKLSYSESPGNQLQNYIVNWLIDNKLVQGNDISFIVSKHTNINVTSSLSKPNIDLSDIIIELESTQDTSCDILLSPVKGSGNLSLYTEEGLINQSSIIHESINISAGRTTKIAVTGEVLGLNLSANKDVSLKQLVINNKQTIENITIESINIDELNLDGYENLCILQLNNNQLKHLNVSNNKKLKTLHCSDNQLTELDLTGNVNLNSIDFKRCTKLTSVSLPNSLSCIEDYAFSFCTDLTSISIPNSVTSIGEGAFNNCLSLDSVVIPNSVTFIGNQAFYYCCGLTSITIPNSVTSIGDQAFYHCYKLTSPTIPNSVTSIGSQAFCECYGLTSITIPYSVTSIGNQAFGYCYDLQNINVENRNKHYKSIDGVLFNADATTLIQYPIGNNRTSYIVPNFVTSIGDWAFDYCDDLTYVTIPNSVTNIGIGAFAECKNLQNINIEAGNSHFKSVDGVLFNADETTLIQYPIGKSRTSYIVPNSVTNISFAAFIASKLTSITIPNSVTTISEAAFWYCYNLTSITIPNSVTSIGKQAFYYCDNLTSVTIGNSVSSIGEGAFMLCDNLQTIVNLAEEPQEIDSWVFYNVNTSSARLLVPDASVWKYKAANVWKDFGTIAGIDASVSAIDTDNIVVSNGKLWNPTGEEIRIYNLNGHNIYSGNNYELQLPAGLYILQTPSGNRKVVF